MTYFINKNTARVIARQELTIFREIISLMEQVIVDSGNGLYETTVSDGTEMTQSTPTITVVGSEANPTITGTPTLIVAGSTITLGTTGTNLNSVIADINDAAISGLVASKNSSNNLVLTYQAPAASTWSISIGAGTANADLGFTDNSIITADDPDSVDYYNAWKGVVADHAKQDQMNQVIEHFESLGYYIERRTNTATAKTFKWVITY